MIILTITIMIMIMIAMIITLIIIIIVQVPDCGSLARRSTLGFERVSAVVLLGERGGLKQGIKYKLL